MEKKIQLKQIPCSFCNGKSTEEGWDCYKCQGTGFETVPVTPEPTEEEWSKGEE